MLAMLLLACDTPPAAGDPDGDGVPKDLDCAEGDPDVYPGAPEYCRDGVVNDCETSDADARAFCALWRDITAEEASAVLTTDERGASMGAAVAGGADVTGDGRPDLLFGAPGSGSGGGVWIVDGDVRGRERLDVAPAVLVGTSDGPTAGAGIQLPGDVDGDGAADVLVLSVGRSDASIHLAHGPFDGQTSLEDGPRYDVDTVVSRLAIGDIDGDGAVDLAFGAPGDDAVYARTDLGETDDIGDADRWLHGTAAELGTDVAVADLDGDGVGDLLAGAPGYDGGRGAAYIRFGPFDGAGEPDLTLTGSDNRSTAGTALAAGGDVDGDGRADALIGAPLADGRGIAWLVTAPRDGALDAVAEAGLEAVKAADYAGEGVAMLGDVDGDGVADVGVGAPDVGSASGGAYVVYGPVRGSFNLSDADIRITTAYDGDELGRVMAGVGDLDGDGRGDFLLGAPLHGDPVEGGGVGWLFLAAPI